MTWFWHVDYVPFIGTAKNTLECIKTALQGDTHRAAGRCK